jgi:thioredoxin 1
MAKPVHIDDNSFDETVIKSKTPVLVDFWAPWCSPCKAVAPILDELANDYKEKIVIAKLNVDESPQNASKYGVSAIPTMLIFKNGEPVHSIVGYKPKPELKKAIDEVI